MNEFFESSIPGSLPDAAIESDETLLRELEKWIALGLVQVENDSTRYFALIESNYPIAVNRVDWARVINVRFHAILPLEERAHGYKERLAALDDSKRAIARWFCENSVGRNEQVIVLGDVSDVALHMTVGTLIECCHVVFFSNQHVYVIPRTAEWCLNYTMEDQLWFGKSADALTTGCCADEE